MKVQEKLDEIKALVEAARTLPMSSSIVVNKAELLELLTALTELLPEDLALAEAVLNRRDSMLYDATANAERLLSAAMDERQRMISEEEVLREARIEAAEVIQAAQERSERTSREIDEYVDAKLAHLEVAVTNILDTVKQGRQRLAEPGLYGELAARPDDEAIIEPGPAPAPLPRRPIPVTEGRPASREPAARSAVSGDAVREWDSVRPDRDSRPAAEAAPDGEPDDATDLADLIGPHAGPAEQVETVEAGEVTGEARGSEGWTPQRPKQVESDVGDAEATEQSAEAEPPEVSKGERPDGDTERDSERSDESTSGSRAAGGLR